MHDLFTPVEKTAESHRWLLSHIFTDHGNKPADFTPCGLSAGFLRNLLWIVDAFFYYLVAAISLAGTSKWQRLGDLVAETVVMRDTRSG